MSNLPELMGEYVRWREKIPVSSQRDKAAIALAEWCVTNQYEISHQRMIEAALEYIIALQHENDLLRLFTADKERNYYGTVIMHENDLHEYRIVKLEEQIRALGAQPYREAGWGDGYTQEVKRKDKEVSHAEESESHD